MTDKKKSVVLLLCAAFCITGCSNVNFDEIKFIEKVNTESSVSLNEIEVATTEDTKQIPETISETTTKYLDDDFYATLGVSAETSAETKTSIETTATSIQTEETVSISMEETSAKKNIYIDDDGIEYSLLPRKMKIYFNARTPLYLSCNGEIEFFAKPDASAKLKGENKELDLILVEYKGETLVGKSVDYSLDEFSSDTTIAILSETTNDSSVSSIESSTSLTMTFFNNDETSDADLAEEITTVTIVPQAGPPETARITTLPITTQSMVTTTTNPETTVPQTNNTKTKGGVDFPDDTTQTSIVFGITFFNMNNVIQTVNPVVVSSGPDYANGSTGYIELCKIDANEQLECIGISTTGWLRVKTEKGIGFIYNEDAILI